MTLRYNRADVGAKSERLWWHREDLCKHQKDKGQTWRKRSENWVPCLAKKLLVTSSNLNWYKN